MQYTHLGRSGLEVSRFGLGTTNFGKFQPEADCHRLMDAALDAGINFIDTANSYGGEGHRGWSEEIIGRWLSQNPGHRDKIILGTKVGFTMEAGPNTLYGLSAYKIRHELESSLRRLNTDRIDLYQMHHIDRSVGWDEIWGTYEALIAEGKVCYAGSSNFSAWGLADGLAHARAHNFLGMISEQHFYSLGRRHAELEMLPACEALGVGAIIYSPLGGGALGGNALKPEPGGRAERPMVQKEVAKVRPQIEAYQELCARIGSTPAAVGLAWVAKHPGVSVTLIGPRNLDQLATSLPALDLKLDDATLAELYKIFPGPGGAAPEAYAW